MNAPWKCGNCLGEFEDVSQLAAHRPTCPEREIKVKASVLSWSAFAFGVAAQAINDFAFVKRQDNTGYIDCKFCLIAVARMKPGGLVVSIVDADGTDLEHRADCQAKRALDEIEKAMKLISEAGR